MVPASELVKKCRTFAGLTQTELGKRVGIQHQHISLYEHGKVEPSYFNLCCILEACGFTLDLTVKEDK